jgi:hypothetical protein
MMMIFLSLLIAPLTSQCVWRGEFSGLDSIIDCISGFCFKGVSFLGFFVVKPPFIRRIITAMFFSTYRRLVELSHSFPAFIRLVVSFHNFFPFRRFLILPRVFYFAGLAPRFVPISILFCLVEIFKRFNSLAFGTHFFSFCSHLCSNIKRPFGFAYPVVVTQVGLTKEALVNNSIFGSFKQNSYLCDTIIITHNDVF